MCAVCIPDGFPEPANRFRTTPGHRGLFSAGTSASDFRFPPSYPQFLLSHLTSTLTNFASATPLDSALTSKRAAKSFTCNTYEKHTQGEGGLVAQASACDLTRFGWLAQNVLGKRHQSRVTNHQSPVSSASLTLLINPAIKLALPFVFARLCTLPEESTMWRIED